MAVNDDHLRQQYNQERIARQIVHTYVTQCNAKIQQLQTRNQETIAESNVYQERITTLQDELNYERVNVETL
jgi:hypothetical protein